MPKLPRTAAATTTTTQQQPNHTGPKGAQHETLPHGISQASQKRSAFPTNRLSQLPSRQRTPPHAAPNPALSLDVQARTHAHLTLRCHPRTHSLTHRMPLPFLFPSQTSMGNGSTAAFKCTFHSFRRLPYRISHIRHGNSRMLKC